MPSEDPYPEADRAVYKGGRDAEYSYRQAQEHQYNEQAGRQAEQNFVHVLQRVNLRAFLLWHAGMHVLVTGASQVSLQVKKLQGG